jgi:lysophospholipase L1-like esterase
MIDKFMVLEGGYRFNSVTNYKPHKKSIIDNKLLDGYYRSQWFNETWMVLGDSISTGMGEGASNAYASKPYHYLLSTERFIHVQGLAVSGYTIGQIYDNVVVNLPPTEHAPKLITIMAGTNDHGFNVPIGAITDDPATGTTFYSRYRKTIEFLQNRYPMATIRLITTIKRYNASGTNGDYTNALSGKVRDYCDAVVVLGKHYSLPVLDIFENLGFTPYNTT